MGGAGGGCVRRDMVVTSEGLDVINLFEFGGTLEEEEAGGGVGRGGVLELAELIERADELHLVDCSVALLADSLDLSTVSGFIIYE